MRWFTFIVILAVVFSALAIPLHGLHPLLYVGGALAMARMGNQVYEQTLDQPTGGDIEAGSAISTSQRSNSNALQVATGNSSLAGVTVAPSAHDAPWAQPVPVWIAVFALLILAKIGAEKAGDKSEFSSIRIGFWNVFVITVVAILGLNAAKWIFLYYRIPGVSQLVAAA